MNVPSPDIAKTLLTELKALRDRHVQFQTRVKATNDAARTRDEEAHKQNVILTERIITLENELKQARESIEACAFLLSRVDDLELTLQDRRFVSSASCSPRSSVNSTRLEISG